MRDKLRLAVDQGVLRPLDRYFALQLAELEERDEPLLLLAAALASRQVGQGDVCFDPALHAETGLPALPPLDEWRQRLAACRTVGTPGEMAPLILDEHDRLYLGRYWAYEQQVAEALRARGGIRPACDEAALRDGLERLFGPAGNLPDWQRIAAALAVLQGFVAISGGPGTGKTHTVVNILALLQEQAGGRLRIGLAAPTGKAAARLAESIRRAKPKLAVDPALRDAIPEQALTLHRLLGYRPGEVRPRRDADNPLHLDLLVVDEASMIDLPRMAHLVAALPPQARLILLGDRDQLASVEAGNVFGDICGDGVPCYSDELAQRLSAVTGQHVTGGGDGRQDSIVLLQKSYRFDPERGIGRLAAAVNAGGTEAVRGLLANPPAEISWRPLAGGGLQALAVHAVAVYRHCFDAVDIDEALACFGRFRLLCALRQGAAGVESLNQAVTRGLRRAGVIPGDSEFYRGRPLMITRNDYALGLFNGDIGMLWPDDEGRLLAWFPLADGGLRAVSPARLNGCETAYAMTVHKSQGSEFERVSILLPGEDVPVLTRELLYTGITRARQGVELWGDEAVVLQAVGRGVRRASGLADKLR